MTRYPTRHMTRTLTLGGSLYPWHSLLLLTLCAMLIMLFRVSLLKLDEAMPGSVVVTCSLIVASNYSGCEILCMSSYWLLVMTAVMPLLP